MARAKLYVLYHPAGFPVTVRGLSRVETLLDRGYLTEKPADADIDGPAGQIVEGAIFANGKVATAADAAQGRKGAAVAGPGVSGRLRGLFGVPKSGSDELPETVGRGGATNVPSTVPPDGGGNYEALTVPQLQTLLKSRGLDDSGGRKGELVDRLLAADAEGGTSASAGASVRAGV